jgi:hypothetical protein
VCIEPFAGGAGYSTYWEPKRVTLLEIDPVLASVWRYLIRVKPQEIMSIPTDIESLDELNGVCEEAKHLVGYWFNRGARQPINRRTSWARTSRFRSSFWGQQVRQRLAAQVERIRHWRIVEGSYQNAPDVEAHWHVDPPYQSVNYYGSDLDYPALAQWCLSRRGFVQVCENDDACWLPFRPFSVLNNSISRTRYNRITHTRGYSVEALYEFTTTPTAHARALLPPEIGMDVCTPEARGRKRTPQAPAKRPRTRVDTRSGRTHPPRPSSGKIHTRS